MPLDGLTFIIVIAGFGLVIAAGAWLGEGSPGSLAGLFPSSGAREWPVGVQEPDAPHFVVAAVPVRPTAEPPRNEIEELYAGPIRSPR
jgi:hypothetical protein